MISAEALKGKKVIGLNGLVVGEIDSTEINVDNWTVTNIRIHVSEDVANRLGYKTNIINTNRPVIALPVEAIDQIGDVITLKNYIKDVKDLELAKTKPSSPDREDTTCQCDLET